MSRLTKRKFKVKRWTIARLLREYNGAVRELDGTIETSLAIEQERDALMLQLLWERERNDRLWAAFQQHIHLVDYQMWQFGKKTEVV